MFARTVMLMLIVVLALPDTMLTRPEQTSHSPWGTVAVEAKGKKHHKKGKQPKAKTITRTVRQQMTQSFTSTETITIPDGAPTTTEGKADPYPTTIEVSGFPNGVITDVNLILRDITHTYPRDIDILLSRSDGRQALVLSDVIDGDDALNVDLTLDDEAAASLPQSGALTSGTFRPTNFDIGVFPDTFAAPAPALTGDVALSAFDGANPNGTWQVWVTDNNDDDVGDIASWELQIAAEVDVQVEEQVKAKKHKKKGKGRR